MQHKTVIESRGLIIKEERLKALKSNVMPNTLVLESTEALPGYFGKNIPDPEKPRSVFIILDKKYDGLFLARQLKILSDVMKHKCYGTFGQISIASKIFYCIRIKNLDCFGSIPGIQNELVSRNINMMKYHDADDSALIRIHKSFLITLISEGVYRDLFEQDRYYLSIATNMSWEDFKKITMIVKSNLENSFFDAAIGAIWTINGLMDIVRIYDKKHDIKRLHTIHQRYESEIRRWTENKSFREISDHEIISG